MPTNYAVQLCISLRPIGNPEISVSAGHNCVNTTLHDVSSIVFDFDTTDDFDLILVHKNKIDSDAITAVEIIDISIFGISDQKFIWAGTYYPDYPSHIQDGAVALPHQSYLGWNGTYKLKITVPVFVWIHQTLNMGWLYS